MSSPLSLATLVIFSGTTLLAMPRTVWTVASVPDLTQNQLLYSSALDATHTQQKHMILLCNVLVKRIVGIFFVARFFIYIYGQQNLQRIFFFFNVNDPDNILKLILWP